MQAGYLSGQLFIEGMECQAFLGVRNLMFLQVHV